MKYERGFNSWDCGSPMFPIPTLLLLLIPLSLISSSLNFASASSMADDMEESQPKSNSHSSSLHLYSQIILRALVISSTLASTLLILSAKQSVLIFGIPFEARYTYSSAFKFFAFANAISSAFCFLSACFLFISRRQLASGNNHGTINRNYYIFFLHDLLIMLLVLSGCSAATAIGYIGKYGNSYTGWSPICDHFGKFCNRVTTSLAISYFAVLCLLILIILSATANPSLTSR